MRRHFTCPACLRVVRQSARLSGRVGDCPKCGTEVRWAKPVRSKQRVLQWVVLLAIALIATPLAIFVIIAESRYQRDARTVEPPVVRGRPMSGCRVGDTISFGDVSVAVISLKVGGLSGRTPAGNEMRIDSVLLLKLRLKNFNANRIATVGGQAGNAVATDDVGNVYDAMVLKSEFGGEVRVPDLIGRGFVRDLRSDEPPSYDTVVFKRPVPGAKRLTIALDGTCYGGTDRPTVLAERAEWEAADSRR